MIERDVYVPKERLVYDPEVKRLLEEIRDRLEPDERDIIERLESDPGLLEKISEIYGREPQPDHETVERAEEDDGTETESGRELRNGKDGAWFGN